MAETETAVLATALFDCARRCRVDDILIPDLPDGARRGRLPPGCHLHEHWEFKFALRGGFVYEAPGLTHRVPEGGATLTPPNAIHVDYTHSAHQMEADAAFLYVLATTDRSLAVGIQEAEAHVVRGVNQLMLEMPGDIDSCFEQVASADADPEQRLLAQCRLGWTLATLGKALRARQRRPQRIDHKLERVEQYINVYYHRSDLDLASIAAAVDWTPNHLANSYKKAHGFTVWDHVIDIRLRQARRLLRGGGHGLADVARLTGWSSPEYFSKVFKRRYGIPPSQCAELDRAGM